MQSKSIITTKLDIMHGEPCFDGTRVTAQTFFDHLEAGYTLDAFLEQFPTVKREQVVAMLELLRNEIPRIASAGRFDPPIHTG